MTSSPEYYAGIGISISSLLLLFCGMGILVGIGLIIIIVLSKKLGLIRAVRFGLKAVKRLKKGKNADGGGIREQLLLAQIDQMENMNGHMLILHNKFKPFAWRLRPSELQFKERIGMGSFGEVYSGMLRGSTPVAIKVLKESQLWGYSAKENFENNETLPSAVEDFFQEISLWSELKHPNVVTFLGACVDEGELCVVSELMEHGPLDRLFGKHMLAWEQKIGIARDAAMAMADLHSRLPPVLHRDLKSQNILLDANLTAKVSDFGLSKVLRDANTTATVVGTPHWMAPEVMRGEAYGMASDVFSFGVVLWQLLTERSVPFQGSDPLSTQSLVLKGIRPQIPSLEDAINLLPSSTSVSKMVSLQYPSFVKLIQCCWSQDPTERPSFIQCLHTLKSMSL